MKSDVHFVPGEHPLSSSKPALVFIPGGPGLSSRTLRSLEILKRSTDLFFVDPAGTGTTSAIQAPSFEGMVESIEKELMSLGHRPLLLVAHSFGALYAIELVRRGYLNLESLFLIAPALTPKSYQIATENYLRHLTPEMKAAAEQFEKAPSDTHFAHSLATYRTLYFCPSNAEAGYHLLLEDRASAASFSLIQTISRASTNRFLEALTEVRLSKTILVSTCDQLLSFDQLKSEAELSGSRFLTIDGAGHFIGLDRPEKVAELIEDQLLRQHLCNLEKK